MNGAREKKEWTNQTQPTTPMKWMFTLFISWIVVLKEKENKKNIMRVMGRREEKINEIYFWWARHPAAGGATNSTNQSHQFNQLHFQKEMNCWLIDWRLIWWRQWAAAIKWIQFLFNFFNFVKKWKKWMNLNCCAARAHCAHSSIKNKNNFYFELEWLALPPAFNKEFHFISFFN